MMKPMPVTALSTVTLVAVGTVGAFLVAVADPDGWAAWRVLVLTFAILLLCAPFTALGIHTMYSTEYKWAQKDRDREEAAEAIQQRLDDLSDAGRLPITAVPEPDERPRR